MPTKKFKNQRAFVDPLSLIAVFLLVVTLAVTTVTVNDPLKKQLISSYAKEKSNFQSYADSLIRQRERSGKCKGSGCVAEEVINNQATQGNNSTAEKSAQTEAEQKIIDTYNKAKSGDLNALKDLKESNSSLGEQVQKELDAKAAVAPKTEENKAPADLTLNQLVGNSSNENTFVSKESQTAQKQLTSYLNEQKNKVDSPAPQVTNQQEQNKATTKTATSGSLNEVQTSIKPKYESQSDCEKNTNPYSPEFKSCDRYANTEENKANVWDNLAGLSSIFKGVLDTPSTNSIADQNSIASLQLITSGPNLSSGNGTATTNSNVYVPKYSSKQECEQNTQKGSREQKACGQFATSNENIKTVFNTLDAVTFGTFSNYAESYAPDNVSISWKAAGYESLKSCQQDMLNKYNNPNAAASCNTYQITKDQLSSSVQLGTVITAEGALAVTGLGYGSGAITGAQALTNGLAVSTVYQTGNATSTCIDNPGSQECKDETKYAALSWANVFTAAGLAGATQNTIQAWRYANAAVNAVNVAADVKDTINSCTGENASGVGCTISSVATLLDVGGGALDIVEIAKDFNFSGLGSNIGGWPVDLPVNGSTIKDSLPQANIIDDFALALVPDSPSVSVSAIDNTIANISPVQITEAPQFNSTSLTNTADELLAELPITLESEVKLQTINGNDVPLINTSENLADLNTANDTTNTPLFGVLDKFKNWINKNYDKNIVNPKTTTLNSNKLKGLDQAITEVNTAQSGQIDLKGYKEGSALPYYKPEPTIQKAIEEVPDPLGVIKNINSASSPEEALISLKQTLKENGVEIVTNPLDERYKFLTNQDSFNKPISDPSQNLGVFVNDGQLRVNDDFGNEFVFALKDAEVKNYIFLHPEFDTLPIEMQLKTLAHETGHFVEQFKLPGQLEIIESFEGIKRPNSEYISSLYGANAALSTNDPIKAGLVGQLELNSAIMGNPSGYLATTPPSSLFALRSDDGTWFPGIKNLLNKDVPSQKIQTTTTQLTDNEIKQVSKFLPEEVAEKFSRTAQESGSIQEIEFEKNRFWSIDIQSKDPRITDEIREELLDALTTGASDAHKSMFLSPKDGHYVLIDYDPIEESSIAKIAKFSREESKPIIKEVLARHGIEVNIEDFKPSDYFYFGLDGESGSPFRLLKLEGGQIMQQVDISLPVIRGSNMTELAAYVPDELKGDGFTNIIKQNSGPRSNTVSLNLPEKGISLDAYILEEREIGQIAESAPKIDIRETPSAMKGVLNNSFETYFSPERWKTILTPDQFNKIGQETVNAVIPNAKVSSISVELKGVVVAGIDGSPISKMVKRMNELLGQGSAEERGLKNILKYWTSDLSKVMDKYGLVMGEFAGDGFKIIGLEKLPPEALTEFTDMYGSLQKTINKAAKGSYNDLDAKLAAEFINKEFNGQIYAKVFLFEDDAKLKLLSSKSYVPVILKTQENADIGMKQIKALKNDISNIDSNKELIRVNERILATYTEKELKKAGMVVIRNEYGVFLYKKPNPIIEWFNNYILSPFNSLLGK